MTESLIIKKYARVAFFVAKKSNSIDVFMADFERFLQVFFANSTIEELSNPAIPKKVIISLVNQIADKLSIQNLVRSFLLAIAKSGRLNILYGINQSLKSLVKIDNNALEIELVSAVKLSDEHLSQIKAMFEKKYHGKIIEFNLNVRPEIMGGLIVKINSLVIDASLKNQLASIKNDCLSLIYQS